MAFIRSVADTILSTVCRIKSGLSFAGAPWYGFLVGRISSNQKKGTIPQEHTLLVDITEQITGQKHSLLPSELQGQVLAGQELQNRYLLLVTPSKPDNITKLRITPHK
ncbi:hypothetical protein [Gimesia maris]|uniref:Uncharacterized protein n=1 Tax=Gimesia maris TaxID=122 RepID=A0ABX5YVB0_9PLAN|nr:hypothetical protein [Gimesia maris]EDL61313.1 hypothetical protein PM8797T_12453 [Gimesia maris DSM 8797]QEG19641.1 hypothetical protein GmarT_55420 [Gimesia maris]QGQ27527.1 hypothetical protein F1729_02040 [Gimesia maris]